MRDKYNTVVCFLCDHRTVLDNISNQSKKTSSCIHTKLCQTLFSDTQTAKPHDSKMNFVEVLENGTKCIALVEMIA